MSELTSKDIDIEHIEHRDVDGCKITIYFANSCNAAVVTNVLDSLLDVFDKRVCATTSPP